VHIDLTVEKTEGASNPEKNWQHWVHKTHDEDKQNKIRSEFSVVRSVTNCG
jgi:hypothetical protein